MANVQYRGTGRRKSSVARVILTPGTGKCEINGKAAKEYLPSDVLLMIVDQPLELTGTKDKFDVKVNVNGGGISGQAGAIRHGIARALLEAGSDYRPSLKAAGLLSRDSRTPFWEFLFYLKIEFLNFARYCLTKYIKCFSDKKVVYISFLNRYNRKSRYSPLISYVKEKGKWGFISLYVR